MKTPKYPRRKVHWAEMVEGLPIWAGGPSWRRTPALVRTECGRWVFPSRAKRRRRGVTCLACLRSKGRITRRKK